MADKTIGTLPAATYIDDASLWVIEQQGSAYRASGAQIASFAKEAANANVQAAVDAAKDAQDAAKSAEAAAEVTAHPPQVNEETGYWQTWQNGAYVDTDIKAEGPPGPQGEMGNTGPQGPQGPTGTGLTVLDRFDSFEELQQEVSYPDVGDNYYVGTLEPYDVYTYTLSGWVNSGPIQGAKGDPGPVFTPTVSSSGMLSWTNNGGLTNPDPINIKGPQGDPGIGDMQKSVYDPNNHNTDIFEYVDNAIETAIAGAIGGSY